LEHALMLDRCHGYPTISASV